MGMLLALKLLNLLMILSTFQVQGSAVSISSMIGQKGHGILAAAPQSKAFHNLSRVSHPPIAAPNQHKQLNQAVSGHPFESHASSPLASFHRNHWRRNRYSKFSPEPYDQLPPTSSSEKGTWHTISPSKPPLPSPEGKGAPELVPSPTIPASQFKMPTPQPIISPLGSSTKKMIRTPSPSPFLRHHRWAFLDLHPSCGGGRSHGGASLQP